MNLFAFLKEKHLKKDVDELLGCNKHIPREQADQLYDKALDLIFKYQQASASLLQLRLNISFENANYILSQLETNGIISPFDGSTPRRILVPDVETAKQLCYQSKPSRQWSMVSVNTVGIDSMDGHDFEYWCASLLEKLGFADVEVTPGSGDQGVDILAKKDGIKYAVQCKCYSSDLGNTPIQEVHAGKAMYNCHVGAVMTNRHFTAGGRQLAEATGVLLWDRDWIADAIEQTSKMQ